MTGRLSSVAPHTTVRQFIERAWDVQFRCDHGHERRMAWKSLARFPLDTTIEQLAARAVCAECGGSGLMYPRSGAKPIYGLHITAEEQFAARLRDALGEQEPH